MSVKLCIFDLDGTILYTLAAVANAGNRMLEELGFDPQPLDDYRFFCGDGAENLVRRCLRQAGGFTEENVRAGNVLNRKFLAEQPLYGVKPYEGMPEALEELRRRGIRLAVFSNKPDNAAKSTVTGIYGGLFDTVLGQTSGIPLKPDPAGALLIADGFGAKPEECLYFGDTGTDMMTGRAAGMKTVGVLWGYRDEAELRANGAEIIIGTPAEIPGLLREDEE